MIESNHIRWNKYFLYGILQIWGSHDFRYTDYDFRGSAEKMEVECPFERTVTICKTTRYIML
jgi:hypothetical protein